jgi:alkyl hydroperoxide reductase subunit AhpF
MTIESHFDKDTLDRLPEFFEELPEPVEIHIWGDPDNYPIEREAVRLIEMLSDRFENIRCKRFPRRENYPYYPVIGVMGIHQSPELEEGEQIIDFGVRLIGLPSGFQMTSLVAAIQCVSFRGMTSEPLTRIKLHNLNSDVTLEMITASEDEGGAIVAQQIFNMAVASPRIRSYCVIGDAFPEGFVRYSINELPHLIINGRTHIEGIIDEEMILKYIHRTI